MRSRAFRSWLPFLILFLASALTYLPFVPQIGFSNDDWYLVYGAHVRGADYFAPAYERDRPMRAFVLAPEYNLFGDDPLPYHLSMYGFRLLGALSLLWMLNQLWPTRPSTTGSTITRPPLRAANLLIALLFLLYPGFLSQPNPVDYQAQIISLFAAMTSLALTVAALKAEKMSAKVIYTVLSIGLTWFYLGLIEYYLGLEVLRLLIIYLLTTRNTQYASPASQLTTRIFSLLRAWLPFAIGPLTFLIWRLFFFSSDRNATDVGLQLGALTSSPTTGLWWLARFVQDTLNVIFLAWGVPLYNLGFNLRLSQTWIGLALAGAVALGVVWSLRWSDPLKGEEEAHDWRAERLWVGFVSAAAGLIPVILVNRHVEFFSLSRYSLASSVGAAMVIVALLQYLSSPRLRLALAGVLIGMSVLTHFANGAINARDTQTVRDFWWQVSWRAPDLRDGTTIAMFYPAPLQEDYFVWGAANLIYNPEPQSVDPIEAPLAGVLLTPENVTRILAGRGADEPDRRNTHVVMDYGNVLVLTQPNPGSCVRVLDGARPELSASDDARIMLVASSSKIENVDASGEHAALNEFVFGAEPAHEWCWYYQQASLARQRGEWALVATLGDSALEHGFYPADSVEWMPFMQAYAMLGRDKDLKKLASILGADPFLESQACSILMNMAEEGLLTPEIETQALDWYCGK